MTKTVVGLMDTQEEAQNAVEELVNSGFERSAIGVVTSGGGRGVEEEEASDTGSGALKGAGAGAALGGIAGLVVGVGAIAIPGIGPLIAAGPIATTLAGAGVGAVAGGGIGALTNMGMSEADTHHYAEGLRRGGVMVSVTTDDNDMAERAAEILDRQGAVNINERADQWRASGWSVPATSATAARTSTEKSAAASAVNTQQDEQVFQVAREELQVGKREVERGGVRVYSHVIETPVEETVHLREEHANIKRRPVDRPLTAAEAEVFQEKTIEIRETAEEPVVVKRGRIVEEVVIGKESTEHDETIRDTVRKTDVEVERTGGLSANRSYTGRERRRNTGVGYGETERRSGM